MVSPDTMDVECVALCDALNTVLGVRTIESCCGHGRGVYAICFSVRDFKALWEVTQFFDSEEHGFNHWIVRAVVSSSPDKLRFWIIGPTGERGYWEAKEIAERINP